MEKLKGKVAFVTGGSRGMGAAIVRRLSEEGAQVVFTHSGKNEEKAKEVIESVKDKPGSAQAYVAQNENSEAMLQAMQAVVKEFGHLDILVNNAGIYSSKSIEDYGLEEYDQMMNINVKAVFVASQFASRLMTEGGRIITIGSNMAERVSFAGGSLYSMSKSALIGLTKGMARDLGGKNITVNLIQPGPVDTDMNPADSEFSSGIISSLAIKRYGTVDEIAGLVSYLCSPESQFITGTSLTIDGGYNS